MSFSKLLEKIFKNSGAGPSLSDDVTTELVHKTGEEEITGNKIFSDCSLIQKKSSYKKGDTTTEDLYWGHSFTDKDRNNLSDILYYLNKKEGITDHEAVIEFRVFGNPHATVENPKTAWVGCGVSPENEALVKLGGEKVQATIYDSDGVSQHWDNVIQFISGENDYGINSLFGTAANTIVGSGEYKDTFLNSLSGNSNENLYLISDQSISFKVNGQDPNNIREMTFDQNGKLVSHGDFTAIDGAFICQCSYFDKGANPTSNVYGAFAMWDKNNRDWGRVLYYQNANSGRGLSIDLSRKASDSNLVDIFGAYISVESSTPQVWASIGSNVDIFNPNTSNKTLLGTSSNRWKEIWCNQSSINTSSDERIKSNIKSIPDDVLDAWGNINWIEFQYNDAISEKGENARIHTGLIAQRVASAFEQANVAVDKYGFYLFDKWDPEEAILDDEGREIRPAIEAGEMYGIRYTEALCVEAAYMRRKVSRLESRIAELEKANSAAA